MTRGPNRKSIGSPTFFLDEQRPAPLGKVGRTDFTALRDAEQDILDSFVRYRSLVRAEENAPSLQIIQEKIERLARSAKTCSDQIADFLLTRGDSRTKIEFRAAMSDLLADHDLSQTQMDEALMDTGEGLNKIDMYLSAARLTLAERVAEGEVVEVSSRMAKDDFYRRLHKILVRHDLDHTVGENSLIVYLVIKLDKQWAYIARSGPEASKNGAQDQRRRKDLAAEIKSAVNTADRNAIRTPLPVLSASKRDPSTGAWVHSPPEAQPGRAFGNAGRGDDREDQADAFRSGHGDHDDLP